MCGGFSCSKNALIALNILFVLIGFILIIIGMYGRSAPILLYLPIIGGIAVCGVILVTISIIGLIGAVKHHQVILFFYMIILFILFLIQFSIASSCLAIDPEEQTQFAREGWANGSIEMRKKVQDNLLCCGFNSTFELDPNNHPSCEIINQKCCPPGSPSACSCTPCLQKLKDTINYTFKLAGSIGLFFSLTEIVYPVMNIFYCSNGLNFVDGKMVMLINFG